MSAEDGRRFARLADAGRVAQEPPRSGLEIALQDRRPAGPDEISPEAHFAAVAARLLAEPCE